ncbi:MAG: hypothetical protein R2764_08310 [Bacteroidales bacterium]
METTNIVQDRLQQALEISAQRFARRLKKYKNAKIFQELKEAAKESRENPWYAAFLNELDNEKQQDGEKSKRLNELDAIFQKSQDLEKTQEVER